MQRLTTLVILFGLVYVPSLFGQPRISNYVSGNGNSYEVHMAYRIFQCLIRSCVDELKRVDLITSTTTLDEVALENALSMIDNLRTSELIDGQLGTYFDNPDQEYLSFVNTYSFHESKTIFIQLLIKLKYIGGYVKLGSVSVLSPSEYIELPIDFSQPIYSEEDIIQNRKNNNVPFMPTPPRVGPVLELFPSRYFYYNPVVCTLCYRNEKITKENRQYYLNGINRYDSLSISWQGDTLVKKGEHYGIIGKNNEVIIPVAYERIFKQGEDYYFVKLNDQYGVYRDDGALIIPCSFDRIVYRLKYEERADEVFLVNKGEKWGVVNKLGEQIVRIEFDELHLLYSKVYKVMRGGKYGLLDTHGEIILDSVYDKMEVAYLHPDRLFLLIEDGDIVDYQMYDMKIRTFTELIEK